MVVGDSLVVVCFFFQAEDGIRDIGVTGVQTWCSSDLFCLRWVALKFAAISKVYDLITCE